LSGSRGWGDGWRSGVLHVGARRSVVSLVPLATFLLAISARIFAQTIQVDLPTRVVPNSATNDYSHFFTSLAAAPDDARQLLVCGIRESSFNTTWQGFVYASHDGGLHWNVAVVDSSSASVSEETCAFGRRHRAYFIAEPWNQAQDPRTSHLHFYRSANAGLTWRGPVVGSWLDYARLTVDNTNGPYQGRVYAFGNTQFLASERAGSSMELLVASGSGRTLAFRTRVPRSRAPMRGNFPQAARVLPNGTVISAVWVSLDSSGPTSAIKDPGQAVAVVTASPGGRTAQPLAIIARVKSTGYRQHGIPSLDVDVSGRSTAGAAYVVWSDSVDGRDRILISLSSDEGRRWSAPRTIDDSPSDEGDLPDRGHDPQSPSVAVNRDGAVGVIWSEQRGDCWRFSASVDGARLFTPSVSLNACPRHARGQAVADSTPRAFRIKEFDAEKGDTARLGFVVVLASEHPGGEGEMVASADGTFHPLWQVRGEHGLWSTLVRIGPADVAGAPDSALTGLSNVSGQLLPIVSNLWYDRPTQTITADLSVYNKDTVRTVVGPLYVRLDRIETRLGQVTVLNADNHHEGAGAMWRIGSKASRLTLRPGFTSPPHRMVFRIMPLTAGLVNDSVLSEDRHASHFRVYTTVFGALRARSHAARPNDGPKAAEGKLNPGTVHDEPPGAPPSYEILSDPNTRVPRANH
jgi:hypothetical protein